MSSSPRPPALSQRGVALGIAIVLALGACVDSREAPPSEAEVALPGDYQVRLDSERSDPGQFRLTLADGGVRIRTGPAGIAWHDCDTVPSGDFRAEATFLQFNAPVGYREAYGIFVGGLDLVSPDQEYTYLLVRPTGDYLIKRRRGETTEVLADWTPHPAVVTVQEEGDEPRNVLAVEVRDGEALFLVNEIEVHRMPVPTLRPYGIAGLRANHRLDILVTDWSVGAIESPSPVDVGS